MIRALFLSLTCLVATACTQPDAPPRPAIAQESIVQAQLDVDGRQAEIARAVQDRLLRDATLSGSVTTHGSAGPRLYSLRFRGDCAGNRDLVDAVTAIARENGANDTSCIPASAFAPGEVETFKKMND